MRTELIILEDERPKTWNRYWAGVHWATRKEEADHAHAIVRAAIDPNVKPFDCQVNITVTTYFKGQMQDSPNTCTKPYIDALIGWFIVDDSPEFLDEVTTRSRKDNDNPRVEILITPA